MDWACKAMLTATTVALLLAFAQLFGRRLAGLLAGLPTVTGPALVWLALDLGPGYAVEAAIGSIAACAVCALFALAYERASRRAGSLVALAVATAAGLLSALPLQWFATSLAPALFVAACATLFIHAAMPGGEDRVQRRVQLRGELWLTALVSGFVSGAVALVAPSVGPFWAGVLASPPLIAAAVAMHQQTFTGSASIRPFLRAYVFGLLGRAVFGAAFALLLVPLGIAGATFLATAAGCVLTVGTLRCKLLISQRPTRVGRCHDRPP